jgi:hypothetical protein
MLVRLQVTVICSTAWLALADAPVTHPPPVPVRPVVAPRSVHGSKEQRRLA